MQVVGEKQFLAGSALAVPRVLGSSGRRVGVPARRGEVVNRAGGTGKVKPGTKSTRPGTKSTKPGTAKKGTAKVGGAASSSKLKELAADENVTSTLGLGALFGATLAVAGYLVTASVQNVAVVPSAPPALESVGIAPIVDRKIAVPESAERKVITSKGTVKAEEPKVVVPPPVEAPAVKAEVAAPPPPPPAPKPEPKPTLQTSAAEKPRAPVTAAQLEPTSPPAKAPISNPSKVAAPAADTADAPALSPLVLGGGVALLALVGGAVALSGGNTGEGGAVAAGAPAAVSAAPAAAGGAQPSAKEWIANWRSKSGGAAPAAAAGGEVSMEARKKQVQAWIAKYKARS